MKKLKVSILLDEWTMKTVLAEKELRRLKKVADVHSKPIKQMSESDACKLIKGADIAVTGWGTPNLSGKILDSAPDLKLVAHAAGSVKFLVGDEVWKRRIKVTTASPAIAISVAEFTFGMMIAGLQRAFPLNALTHAGGWKTDTSRIKGLCGTTVGIIGAGFVGRNVISLMKQFPVTVLLCDPCVTAKDAARLGTIKVTLEMLAEKSDVVSLHAPSLPSTRHMINAKILKLMKPDAVFINTSRGALVDESALASHLRKRPDMQAFIDVTDPEPPLEDSPLRKLENVILTPHIAGFGANFRQGELAVTEIERFISGRKPAYPVTKKMLERMA